MPSLLTALKALVQLGPQPLALYALYQLGLRSGHYRRAGDNERSRLPVPASLTPLLALPAAADIVTIIGNDGLAALREEADEIVRGQYRPFGGQPQPLHLSLDQPLQHWTQYELGRVAVPYDGLPIHDVKFIWEPARFGWALTLGRAHWLTRDEEYAESFWKCFEEFSAANPPYLGPHWMNGQEVALRLMSLLWAAQLFDPAAATSAERRSSLHRSLAEHASRVSLTLVYARSQNNNHLVTESAALFAAGIALGEPRWRLSGWKWLNHALQHQISSYGEYIQHSTNYHRVMLQSALWVDAILRGRREHWQPVALEALMRASHWLFSMIDPLSGGAPDLGANDGALILPLASASFSDFRPTVQAAARAFLRTSLPAGKWDELAAWLGLPAGVRTADSDAYMGDNLRGRNSWAYLRASRFRSRLSHIDQLHFDLWRGGENIVRDAGTYLYNAPAPWENPLVTTRVHNTVTVDGQDQMQRGGRFMVLDWSPAYSRQLLEVDENILGRIIAYHKGYRRLGIRHERVATVYADERWEVRDSLVFTKPGEHTFRFHWLLQDGEWSVRREGASVTLAVALPSGPLTLRMQPDLRISTNEPRLGIIRAGERVHGTGDALPFEGWVSPTYGEKLPALSVAVEVTSFRSFSFLSEFIFG